MCMYDFHYCSRTRLTLHFAPLIINTDVKQEGELKPFTHFNQFFFCLFKIRLMFGASMAQQHFIQASMNTLRPSWLDRESNLHLSFCCDKHTRVPVRVSRCDYNMSSSGNNAAAWARFWKKSNIGADAAGRAAGTAAIRLALHAPVFQSAPAMVCLN